MALPAIADFTGSGITQAQFKTAISELRTFLATLLGTDGTVATALAALDTLFAAGVTTKSGAYTVAATDRGQLFNCTGTWAMALPAAAAAGAGFAFAVRNSGSGVITIDGNGSETVDGALTISLSAGTSAVIVSTGAAWVTVGKVPVVTPSSIGAVSIDNNYNNIGSLCFAYMRAFGAKDTTYVSPGQTVAGSSLSPTGVGPDAATGGGGTLPGTWRCLGIVRTGSTFAFADVCTLYQRVA